MGSTPAPPYTATLTITNPGGQSTSATFQVVAPSAGTFDTSAAVKDLTMEGDLDWTHYGDPRRTARAAGI
jgi:hypothetical protein